MTGISWFTVAGFAAGMALAWWIRSFRIAWVKWERDEALKEVANLRADLERTIGAGNEQVGGVLQLLESKDRELRARLDVLGLRVLDGGPGAGPAPTSGTTP